MASTFDVDEVEVNGLRGFEPRVRLVSVVVQLNLVADDGNVLEPLNVQPIQVPAKEWPNWDVARVIAEAQNQLAAATRP